MTDAEFIKLVDRGMEALGDSVLSRLQNVAVVVEAEPTHDQCEDMGLGNGERLFGLYEGVPLSERGLEEGFRLPDKITIFKQPILEAYEDPADIVKCIENTVWHEVAHHFGWGEEWVEAEEQKRDKLL